MKYNLFSVDDSERNRILFLHEQVKNRKLISEIDTDGQKTSTGSGDTPINFSYNFKDGYWSRNSIGIETAVEAQLITPILEFIGNNQGSKIELVIQVGESKKTNYDAEAKVVKGQQRQKLEPGVLAKRRGETIIAILTQSLTQLINDKRIDKLPKMDVEFVPPKREATDKDYKLDQFVRVVAKVNNSCFEPFTISIDYDEVAKQKNLHDCDNAKFKITANGVVLKEDRGWEYADLNNGQKALEAKLVNKVGDFRYNSFSIDEKLAKEILKVDPNKITISSECIKEGYGWQPPHYYNGPIPKTGCHPEVARVTVYRNSDNKQIFPPFFPQSATGVICVLDKCGNPFK